MGSGEWFKTIISSKKAKGSPEHEKSNGCSVDHNLNVANDALFKNHDASGVSIEDKAATRIQTVFRAYKARKAFGDARGIMKLQALKQGHSIKKQASMTLSYLHSWSRIQAQIRARRACMVLEGRLRKKKLDNRLKLESKFHEVEVEWNAGSETMEEVLAKIHQREDAAVKRERALAYAFSHQWRPNSKSTGNPDFGKANWGWSWLDQWISACPWEGRGPVQSSLRKGHTWKNSNTGKVTKTPVTKTPVKMASPNGKIATKARKLSYEAAEKRNAQKGEGKTEGTKC